MIAEDASPEVRGTPPPAPLAPAVRETSAKERREQREHNHLVNVLATEDGRALIWRILDHCRPYNANAQTSEYLRGIQEGERRVALWLLTLIDGVDSFGYAKMIEDNVQREQRVAATEQAIEHAGEKQRADDEANLTYWDRFRRYILPKSFK